MMQSEKTAALQAKVTGKVNVLSAKTGSGKSIDVDLSLAKSSCKHCYGTGFMGTRLHKGGKKERLVCACVAKAMARAGLV